MWQGLGSVDQAIDKGGNFSKPQLREFIAWDQIIATVILPLEILEIQHQKIKQNYIFRTELKSS